MIDETIFKANDIRGIYPSEINEEAAKRFAVAYAIFFQPKKVAVGRDVHLASPSLEKAIIEGFIESGVDVMEIGLVPTDGSYFAAGFYKVDGSIQATASHLPKEFGGIKFVKKGAVAPSEEELLEIKRIAISDETINSGFKGKIEKKDITEDYLSALVKLANLENLPPLKIVANANFGVNGIFAEKLIAKLDLKQIELIKQNFEPNGQFPKGRPDPLVSENRQETSKLVQDHKADMGVAWDADGDRCYIVDEKGEFIEGCHLTALLAKYFLQKYPLRLSSGQAPRLSSGQAPRLSSGQAGQKVVYESRNIWAVKETIEKNNGIPILSHTGHTYIKATMRSNNAVFGGEMSGHFYYRDFYYADSGLATFITFLSLIACQNKKVSEIVQPLRQKYVVSGEYNFVINDKNEAMKIAQQKYKDGQIDHFEGLSVSFDNWRFNLRPSNTENLIRLNVEAKDKKICQEKLEEIKGLIEKLV